MRFTDHHFRPGLAKPLALLLLACTALFRWTAHEQTGRRDFLVHDRTGFGRVIIVPAAATAEERAAASLLARTLAEAAGGKIIFPIRAETRWQRGPAIHVGATRLAARTAPMPPPRDGFDRPVSYRVTPTAVLLQAAHREDIGHAASLFLEDAVQARWFMPGALGLEVARRDVLRLALAGRSAAGAYYSRNLGGVAPGFVGAEWFRSNRLNSLLTHGHTASDLVTYEDMKARPDFAPWLHDQRFIPDQAWKNLNWQPDLLAPGLPEFIFQKAARQLQKNPRQLSFCFGQNDSYRFDQSARTLATLEPVQHFRGKPDYADLLFTFLNRLAAPLAEQFPDRVLTTYAYYWTENTPRFPVAPNIVPYLTADRSNWFEDEFRQNDQALIARWGRAGPRFFALYDYLYGAPFVVPRPTLWAVTEPIPYAYRQGARAYYAEMTPNWSLDGPKAWLAAQLLWTPTLDPRQLLDEYYTRFWREAAAPMRAFHELCDRQWWNQPKPAHWLRYFRIGEQCVMFPPAVREALSAHLRQAQTLAASATTRERVAFVADGFAVAAAFCEHFEEHERFARLAQAPDTPTGQLLDAWRRYREVRSGLSTSFAELKRHRPLAIQTADLDIYLRSDPRRRVARTLAQRGELARIPAAELAQLFGGHAPAAASLLAPGRELHVDPELRQLTMKRRHPFFLTDWVASGPWIGRSEPQEHRRIALLPNPDGSQRLRISGGNTDNLWQVVKAKPGALYRATARVRGQVSPGNRTYLLVFTTDKTGGFIGAGHADFLLPGDTPEWKTMDILLRAPAPTDTISANVRTFNQMPGDWVEWERVSLRELPE